MDNARHLLRKRSEFAVVTIQLFCEADRVDEVIRAAVESDGGIFAETIQSPRALQADEWESVDEIVNFVAHMAEVD